MAGVNARGGGSPEEALGAFITSSIQTIPVLKRAGKDKRDHARKNEHRAELSGKSHAREGKDGRPAGEYQGPDAGGVGKTRQIVADRSRRTLRRGNGGREAGQL